MTKRFGLGLVLTCICTSWAAAATPEQAGAYVGKIVFEVQDLPTGVKTREKHPVTLTIEEDDSWEFNYGGTKWSDTTANFGPNAGILYRYSGSAIFAAPISFKRNKIKGTVNMSIFGSYTRAGKLKLKKI